MERYTAEQIAKFTGDICNPIGNRRAINKMYYEQDESHLWPIRGRFNVTKRAIRKAGEYMAESGDSPIGIEYCYLLEGIMSEIVNNNNNW